MKEKIKTFVRENKGNIAAGAIIVATSSTVFCIGYLSGKHDWKISQAKFNEYRDETGNFAILHIHHNNRKTTDLRFKESK
jgi:hypothetical protein